MKYLVAQLGARRHYAIPSMLHEAGMLETLYTDICAVKGWPLILNALPKAWRPDGVKRLLGRIPYGVPSAKIRAFTQFGWKYQRLRSNAATPSEVTLAHIWAGKHFFDLILRAGLGEASGVYTFNGAGLELLTEARNRGLKTVMDQTMAPFEIEQQLLVNEHQKFPGWETPKGMDKYMPDYIERERAEWEQSDLILCGSEFVRDGIAACGGPTERCRVVPFGVNNRFSAIERVAHEGPLRVLTIGGLGLRKGSPYVLAASKAMQGKAVFRMVGGGSVSPREFKELASHVELTGALPRSEIWEQLAWADVFFLPSLCEGSAMVVYEALSAGLPVICTPNSGSVVRNGIEGYIVPACDIDTMVKSLDSLVGNPHLLHELGTNARTRAGDYGLDKYRARLLAALSGETNLAT